MITLKRALTRHLYDKLAQLIRTDYLIEAKRDPTEVLEFTGYVAFMYDPWEDPGRTALEGGIPRSATYSITATAAWGIRVRLVRVSGDADVVEFYVPGIDETDRTAGLEELNKLLDGSFGPGKAEAEDGIFGTL